MVQPSKMWSCVLCRKVFQHYTSLLGHRRLHSTVKLYHCGFRNCSRAFCTLSEYQSHRRSHIDKRIYKCQTCRTTLLTRSHHLAHNCTVSQPIHRCRQCGESFPRILSLAHHVRHKHSGTDSLTSRRITTVINLRAIPRSKVKGRKKQKTEADGSDKDKILLKIQAGRSTTIISPFKPPRSEKKSKCRKKSKKKKRKEEKEMHKNGIILSIKNGSVNLPFEKRSDTSRSSEKKRTKCQVVESDQESRGGLKLKIRSYTDLPQIEKSPSSQKKKYKKISKESLKMDKGDSKVNSVLENCYSSLQTSEEPLLGNKIVIQKDKSGKLLSKPLSKTKVKRRDRENVFDAFSAGTWKVMPSPRTDSPLDGIKLKLSPHKPVRLESGLDCSIENSKCLDSVLKSPVDVADELDVFDGLPVDDKLESLANNVNDSGIEVLSSSSCNRSNENSVRSVVMDENSPSYFNMIDDSLLSVDSPESVKSSPMICPRCGGLVQEANNNTRSPGKCRCSDTSMSNPNSPLKIPVSPLKTNINSSDIYRNHEHVPSLDSEPHRIKSKVAVSLCNLNCQEMPSTATTTSLKNEYEVNKCPDISAAKIDDDVMIVLKESSGKDTSKLKLKLRTRKIEMSPLDITSEPVSEKSSISQIVPMISAGVNCSPQDISVPTVENTMKPSAAKSCDFDSENGKDSENVPTHKKLSDDSSQSLARRKPLFKSKKSSDKLKSSHKTVSKDNECESDKQLEPQLAKNKCSTSPQAADKELGVEKESSHLDSKAEVIVNNKKPIFKKRSLSLKRSFSGPVDENPDECLKIEKEETSPVSLNLSTNINDHSKNVTENVAASACTAEAVPEEICQIKETKVFESNVTKQESESKTHTDNIKNEDKLCAKLPKSKAKETSRKPILSKSESKVKSYSDKKTTVKTKSELVETEPSMMGVSNMEAEPVVTGVTTVQPGDDDSLLTLTTIQPDLQPPSPKHVSKSDDTSPLNLFQQQFLSFLSSSKPAAKIEDPESNESVKSAKKKNSQQSVEKKSDSSSSSSRPKTKSDKGNKVKANDFIAAFSDDDNDFDLNKTKKESDSFSWLKIFTDDKNDQSKDNKADKTENKNDVDFKDDLAAINKKMDSVDDEDSNSLDVDDVFKSQHLSSLQPKDFTLVDSFCGTLSSSKPAKRPQTAKCSSGRLKKLKKQSTAKPKYKSKIKHYNSSDSDHLSSCFHKDQSESDPDFNPFHDSDDDFVVAKPIRKKERLSRHSKGQQNCDSMYTEVESNVSERTKRSKQGRKSCCPCCLGSPRKSRPQDHEDGHESAKHPYRLPRRHKTFVRSSLQLLQLQEKIHTLFLTLFPDCAEIITKSKVGTDEFEALIDEVLYGMEGENCDLSPSIFSPSDTLTPQPFDKAQDTMCHNDTDGLVYPTTHGLLQLSNSLASPIDLQSIENDSHTLSHPSTNILNASCSNDLQMHGPKTCCKEASGMQLSVNSSQRCAFSEQIVKMQNSSSLLTTGPCRHESAISSTCPYTEGHACKVCTHAEHAGTHVAWDDCAFGPQGSECSSLQLNPHSGTLPESELPSELVITIDLGAARVSLCREPKDCLQRLHQRMVRLARCCLPQLNLNKVFYKNLDNVEFLIDMMIKANTGVLMEDLETSDDEPEVESVKVKCNKWKTSRSRSRSCTPHNSDKVRCNKNDTKDVSDDKIKQERNEIEQTKEDKKSNGVDKSPWCLFDDIVSNTQNVSQVDKVNKVVERVPVLSKYQEQFELEIKSKRESLKKDIFESEEEEDVETVYKSPEEVLSSIQSLNKKFSRQRRGKGTRLRKRSADEKRTLFVQEKILNNQNSSIIYSSGKFTNKDLKPKAARRNRSRSTSKSKKQFLSELNLGDKHADSPADSVTEDMVTDVDSPAMQRVAESLLTVLDVPEVIHEEEEEEVKDPGSKRERSMSGDKNIFELMQPSQDTAVEDSASTFK